MSIVKLIAIGLIVNCLFLPSYALSNPESTQVSVSKNDTGSSPVHLNKKVFSWTDQFYIRIDAPDFNSDPNVVDVIGTTTDDKVTVSTTGHSIPYQLVETGTNTGIFTGYLILTGDPAQKGSIGVDGEGANPSGMESSCNPICGPTDGFLPSTGNDGISVSFEYSRDRTVTGSALISWNAGEVKWLQSNYPAGGKGTLQIFDPDMNLNPKAIDKFETSVWSDSDSGGIKLTMTETGESTGVFEGTVYFTADFQSSGNRLHVSDGDTVTAEYVDRTLPYPHSPSDQLRMVATTSVGTSLPPLEKTPASNARILDSSGNVINKVSVNQQVQIVSDVINKQSRDQPFTYLVQIQDNNGITLSLSWIGGTLSPNQALSLGQSWMPRTAGTYSAQIFVWQSIVNPNALSPPLTLQIPAT